jgi:LPXTG-motif cell wall-anchored protein
VTGRVTAGPYPARLGTTLAPGQFEPVWFAPADQIADGPWNATVTLRSGLTAESYSAKITFPRGPGTAPQGTAHPVTGRSGVVTILLVILIALLAALALGIVAYRRRRHRQTA